MRLIDAEALEREIRTKDIMGGLNYSAFIRNAPTVEPDPKFYPPCIDCNTKMDEIRRAYDKIKEQRQIGCDKCAMNGSGSKYCDNCKYDRRTGEWTEVPRYKGDAQPDLKCPFCGLEIDYYSYRNFCASCGAKMIGQRRE